MSARQDATRHAAGALLRGEVLAGAHLRVADGSGSGRRIPLRDDQLLGRGGASDVRLEDPGVSRRHARLSRDGDRWIALDLGSKNGLRVNGRRCRRPFALRAGDELWLGTTRLVLEPGLLDALRPAEPGEAPLPSPPASAVTRAPRRVTGGPLLVAAGLLVALAAAVLALPQ